jgi:aspartyl-tRNA(Asn)/glutamyl-tRNA(Gln) amidotransferase subunit B
MSAPTAAPASEAWEREGYEPVIGLEVHVQLKTASKIFCSCSTSYGAPPNTQVCPICLGFPGSLPVLNARAVEYAVKAALALNCSVQARSIFARKNYFYPDLPKGYQISQFDLPLATDGWLEVGADPGAMAGADPGAMMSAVSSNDSGDSDRSRDGGSLTAAATGSPRRIGITRLHLEEDAGKSFHGLGEGGTTTLDFNRCGVPLIEIVSEPDLTSPAEAYLYLTRLKQVLRYVGVSDVNMEEGSLRCDANVSVRPRGSSALGTKTEVKNLNSFKNVERALTFEIQRQVRELVDGRAVTQQTLLWDAHRGESRPMRTKELSHDYRYFPEPDLDPLVVDALQVQEWRDSLPELPAAKEQRLASQYGLPAYDAGVLSADAAVADWFEAAVAAFPQSPKEVSNWVMGEVLRVLNERQVEIEALPVRPEQLGELLVLKEKGEISGRTAKGIFDKMLESGKGPREILEEENLGQISDESELRALAEQVLEERPQEVLGYLNGREQLLSFFIGEVMKKTRGRANPRAAGQIFRELLEARREQPLGVAPAPESGVSLRAETFSESEPAASPEVTFTPSSELPVGTPTAPESSEASGSLPSTPATEISPSIPDGDTATSTPAGDHSPSNAEGGTEDAPAEVKHDRPTQPPSREDPAPH